MFCRLAGGSDKRLDPDGAPAAACRQCRRMAASTYGRYRWLFPTHETGRHPSCATSYIFYAGASSAGVNCSRRWPPPHYPSPNNAIGLVAQCELGGYVKLGCWLSEAVGRKFSHRPGSGIRAIVGVVRWPPAGNTGYAGLSSLQCL